MLALVVTLSLASAPPRAEPRNSAPPHEIASGLVKEMVAAERAMNDSTMVMHKRERVGGKLLPRELMLVKFQRPHGVYAKWIGKAHKGREVLWRRGWNQGKIRVNTGFMTVNLDPSGWLAMQGQRHAIDELGFSYTIKRMEDDTARANGLPDVAERYEDLGFEDVHGERARCWRSTLPRDRDPRFYGDVVKVCAGLTTKMPVSVTAYERDPKSGKLILVEEYSYAKIRINAGLPKNALDPNNPNYKF